MVSSVVQTVAANLGITIPAEARPSPLQTEQEVASPYVAPIWLLQVDWCMEVICHGLCLPLDDHMVIRDCVNIYCEWLSALLPNPKLCVPRSSSHSHLASLVTQSLPLVLGLCWSSLTCTPGRSSLTSTICLYQGREKVSRPAFT